VDELAMGLGRRSETVLRALRADIESGKLAPGDRLPTQEELCGQFSISHGTVRRAISRLVADGLVSVRQGSGMYVRPSEASAVQGSQTISVMFAFNAECLTSAHQRALSHGYLTCVYPRSQFHWDAALERSFLKRVRAERHRGLLAFCTPNEPRNDDLLAEMVKEGIRVIHIEHYRGEPPKEDFILPDYSLAGNVGAVQLMMAGYEELYFAGWDNDWPGGQLLQGGFADALRIHRGDYSAEHSFFDFPLYVDKDEAQAEVARRFVRQLTRPTGILCRSVDIADYFVRFIRETELRCPEDVGVIGVPYLDEIYSSEGVDTVEFDRMGSLLEAVDLLAQPTWPRVRKWVAPTVVRRGTIRPAAEESDLDGSLARLPAGAKKR